MDVESVVLMWVAHRIDKHLELSVTADKFQVAEVQAWFEISHMLLYLYNWFQSLESFLAFLIWNTQGLVLIAELIEIVLCSRSKVHCWGFDFADASRALFEGTMKEVDDSHFSEEAWQAILLDDISSSLMTQRLEKLANLGPSVDVWKDEGDHH